MNVRFCWRYEPSFYPPFRAALVHCNVHVSSIGLQCHTPQPSPALPSAHLLCSSSFGSEKEGPPPLSPPPPNPPPLLRPANASAAHRPCVALCDPDPPGPVLHTPHTDGAERGPAFQAEADVEMATPRMPPPPARPGHRGLCEHTDPANLLPRISHTRPHRRTSVSLGGCATLSLRPRPALQGLLPPPPLPLRHDCQFCPNPGGGGGQIAPPGPPPPIDPPGHPLPAPPPPGGPRSTGGEGARTGHSSS